VSRSESSSPQSLMTRWSLKPKNQSTEVLPRLAHPAKTLCEWMRRLWQTFNEVESMKEMPEQQPFRLCK
jgi:hypothetical protein